MEVISKLLSLVSDDLLESLVISTEVNKFIKKLQGISERLTGMKSIFFEEIFHACARTYKNL